MHLTNESKILLNFFSQLNLCNIKLNNISKNYFLYIFEIYKYFNLIKYNKVINTKIYNKLSINKFLSYIICDYINNNKSIEIEYTFYLLSRKIKLSYFIFKDSVNLKDLHDLDIYTNNATMILYLLSINSLNKSNKELNIKIYLTPFTKKLPNQNNSIIGINNVNSGYSKTSNGNIIIYRKQEWFKVFIHECIHSFGLEFSNLDLTNFNNNIKKLFPINSNLNIYEAYTEIWANIINISLISFLYSDNDIKIYLKYILYFLKYEREFSNFQVNKILLYNNLSYIDLFKKENKYQENTSIFSYYIIKDLFLQNINEFIEWCYYNNTNYFNFNKNKYTLDLFYKFIKEIVYKSKFLKNLDYYRLLKKNNIFISNNLRMTIIEI